MPFLLSLILCCATLDSGSDQPAGSALGPMIAPVGDVSRLGVDAVANGVRLDGAEALQRMEALPHWEMDGEALVSDWTFKDFVGAIAFVNRLVQPAEQLGHHPEITVNYNRVTLRLTTHDAGGLTELDFQLASQISRLRSDAEAKPEARD